MAAAFLSNMPWPGLTDSLKKLSIKYLIQHYLGHYLSDELDLSQLNVELYGGKCSIVDGIPLDVDTINNEVSSYVPLKFLEGRLGRIEVSIPWHALWTESCTIHLEGIRLNFCKLEQCQRHDANQASSILSKSLMTSSMEIAEEIVNSEKEKFEGLDKFAHLINSVIRRFKLSATNTVVKFVLPHKRSGAGQEIELRVGHIRCEEEEIALDKGDGKTEKGGELSDVVTKRITVEGIEVLINDILITKLSGNHTVKVQFDGNRIDTEVYLSSYIFAILNSDHLKVLQEFILILDDKGGSSGGESFPQGKPLSPQDYRYMQEMMHKEVRMKANPMTGSILSYNNKWTSDSAPEEEDRFLPFTTDKQQKSQQDAAKAKDGRGGSDPCVFTCNLKVPGILLCLISNNADVPIFEEMPQINTLESFIGINGFLNEILHQYDHIRLSASNLCVEVSTSALMFSCINVSVYEYHEGELNNILFVKDDEEATDIAPSVRLKMDFARNCIDIKLASSALKLDLTLIERHHKLLEAFTSGSANKAASQVSKPNYRGSHDSDHHQLALNIECEKLEAEMYFPVADMRPDRTEYSHLHNEILLVELTELSVTLTADGGEVVCSQIEIDMRMEEKTRKVFHSQSESKEISLHLSTLSPAQLQENASATTLMDSDFLLSTVDSMADSINFFTASTINHSTRHDTPFQVKRKMFGKEEGNEQILTPGDREHQTQYLTANKQSAKLYIYIHVPYGDVFLEDKAMFELIYNRFVNDLILWTPNLNVKSRREAEAAAEAASAVVQQPNISAAMSIDSSNIFTSAINDSTALGTSMMSSSMMSSTRIEFGRQDSHETAGLLLETSNLAIRDTASYTPQPGQQSHQQQQQTIFFSCRGMGDSYDSLASETSFHSIADSNINGIGGGGPKPVNEFMLQLEIDSLNVDFYTASRRRNTLFTQNLSLGVVVGPESEHSTVVCLVTDNLMYKCEDRPIVIGNSYMDVCSGGGGNNGGGGSNTSSCIVNIAVEIKRETAMLKKIKLALQAERALLLGIDLPIFDELYTFVNLKDDEILGYVCPKVVVELHTDIVQSGVSFDLLKERPTLLHVEDIYLTSMVIENTAQTILRFFIEEALLCFKRNNVCAEAMKNYITVIDSGIIDLNLKLSKDGRLELKISNNEINVKACPDSLATLCQFLQSFAAQLIADQQAVEGGGSGADGEAGDQASGSKEMMIHKNNSSSSNGCELIADALHECSSENEGKSEGGSGDSADEDGWTGEGGKGGAHSNKSGGSSNNCSNCDGPRIDESTFWMLGDDDLGAGINLTKEPQVRVLTDQPIRMIENHFKLANYNVIPEITPSTVARYLLEKMSLRVSLYAGKDFDDIPSDGEGGEGAGVGGSAGDDKRSSSRLDVISQTNLSLRSGKSAVGQHFSHRGEQQKAVRFQQNTSSVVWENIDLMSNNGYLTNNVPVENHFSFKCAGGSKRKADTCVVLVLKRLKMLFENFDRDYELAWRLIFLVQEVEILDRVNASKIKKLLYEYFSESTPQRKNSNMFSLRMTCHRNLSDLSEECDMKVSLKPLRINVDQDTLVFLMEFFRTMSDILEKMFAAEGVGGGGGDGGRSTAAHSSHSGSDSGNEGSVKRARTESKSSFDEEALRGGAANRDIQFSDEEEEEEEDEEEGGTSFSSRKDGGAQGHLRRGSSASTSGSFENIFVRSFAFTPDVLIKLDYHGKHIDLKNGALPGLLLGLAQLNQCELHLKKLNNKHGLLGFEKVLAYAIEEWAKDIKSKQLPSILGGVGPINSFIKLFHGIRDLFWMPIDQYRRDRRIVRGLQRGAYAFSVSTAMATLELANRLVNLIQCTAQFAHDVVTPPSNYRAHHQLLSQLHHSQPRDLREGLTAAYTVMREGMHDTVRGVTRTGLAADSVQERMNRLLMNTHNIAFNPIIHMSQATSSVLVGMRNQLAPEARKDDHEKWKNANER